MQKKITKKPIAINKRKQQGVMTIMLALSLSTIISLVAISLNISLFNQEQSRLEQAIESSVLAIGLAGSDPSANLTLQDYREIVISMLSAFFPNTYQDINFDITPPANAGDPYTIIAEKQFEFIMASWLAWRKIETSSQIKLGSKIGVEVVQGNIEIALIMDNSGSMYADIDTLKESAHLFVNQLIDNRAHPDQVYISIVPFSYSVNIGRKNLHWIFDSLPADALQYGACTNYRYSTSPADQLIQHANLPPIATKISSSSKKFPGYASGPFAPCAETAIMGLTNSKPDLLTQINQMVASGSTDGDQGIIWGWRTLSEKWQGLWPETSDRPRGKNEVKKVALFFSDGAAISNEREIFLPVCEAMKDEGIEIYTVQFSASNDSMQACASQITGRQHYFYANNQQQLKQAFSDISQNVGFELRLKKL